MNIIEKTFTTNGQMETRTKTERIILHHADSSSCTVEDIDRWHKGNGWSKIGYHFFINKKGEIYRGREENMVGAHAYGSNFDSLGICFEGKYQQEQMPDIQKEAGKELVSYLKEKYNIELVEKHGEVNQTSCPGDNFPFDEIANGKPLDNTANVQEENNNLNEESNGNTTDIKAQATGKIAEIQKILNERYSLNITVDNIYGEETKKAFIKGLQAELNKQFARGLDVDGIYGPKTKKAYILVKSGATGNITWLIQAKLVCYGYNLEIDGIYGINTAKAVKEFQQKNNLAVDGICGENTFNALFA